ncbi:serine hydrolase [Singulisphaera sp. PoT]|uniref:serine hydrolase n=1 Tax=Singulisphaera sp. PoT TaxID=3411797 RepID=UPI003BF5040C
MPRPRAIVSICLPLLIFLGTSLPARAAEPDSLQGKAASIIEALAPDATVAVAFRDLATGEHFGIRDELPMHPASTMKVPVMMEVYHQAAAGRLSLDDRLPVKNSFVSIADGSPYQLDPKEDSELTLYARIGGEATLRDLIRLMITESSNLATNLIIDKISAGSTTAFMESLGAKGVKVLRGVEDDKAYAKGLNNVTTAQGLARLLMLLAEKSVVSERASAEMLEILLAQKFNDGIPAGLPRGIPVAHKTGSFQGVYHDAAIVMPPNRKPFVLVVLTRGIDDEAKAHKLVAEIARTAYAQAVKP